MKQSRSKYTDAQSVLFQCKRSLVGARAGMVNMSVEEFFFLIENFRLNFLLNRVLLSFTESVVLAKGSLFFFTPKEIF